MIAPNRCPPGWVERSCEQRHSPRSAGTCSPFQGVNINDPRWIPAKAGPMTGQLADRTGRLGMTAHRAPGTGQSRVAPSGQMTSGDLAEVVSPDQLSRHGHHEAPVVFRNILPGRPGVLPGLVVELRSKTLIGLVKGSRQLLSGHATDLSTRRDFNRSPSRRASLRSWWASSSPTTRASSINSTPLYFVPRMP